MACAQNEIQSVEYEREKREFSRDTVLYKVRNMEPRIKVPNLGIWEEGKYEFGNMEEGHFEIWARESAAPLREPL